MKSFKQFLEEGMDLGYQFDNALEQASNDRIMEP
jgi:hypothetical protein